MFKKKEKDEKKQKTLYSEKLKARDRRIKTIKLILSIISLFLIIIYFLLRVVYGTGKFTITLDQEFAKKSGLVMYESILEKNERRILEADRYELMDNISVNWLPDNLDTESDGSHNGNNYIAYTFYLENMGSSAINYWYTLIVDDVIKDVDDAVRIMIYHNGESTVYAKWNASGGNETGTVSFISEKIALMQQRTEMQPGDIDKMTIVIWIEGDDPECLDNLIGGEIKMHMEITEEHVADT